MVLANASVATISSSTWMHNMAVGPGGALAVLGGSLATVTNADFQSNVAGSAGALFATDNGTRVDLVSVSYNMQPHKQ